MEIAQDRPDDRAGVQVLAAVLQRLADDDADFDARLRTLWAQAGTVLAGGGAVVNSNTGTVSGHLIQGRDFTFEGGLHLGEPGPPTNPR